MFFSTDGGLSGTQAAIWLDAGNELTLRPNIDNPLGQNWVNIQGGGLRSKGTPAGSQWALSHSGAISGRTLSVVDDVRARSLTGNNNNWAIDSAGNIDVNYAKVWQNLTLEGNAYMNGTDVRMTSLPAGDFSANVGWAANPLGRLYRITSNRAIKVNIEDLDWDEDAILSLRPRVWYGRPLVEHHLGKEAITETEMGPLADPAALEATGMPRTPGLVAEEVEELGLTELAVYDTDDDGNRTLSGVNYDRLAAALIPIIRRQRDRITDLQEENEAMRSRLASIETHLGL